MSSGIHQPTERAAVHELVTLTKELEVGDEIPADGPFSITIHSFPRATAKLQRNDAGKLVFRITEIIRP